MVGLMRRLSSNLGGHRSVESDSHKTCEFSALKSRVKKRTRTRDEPSGGSHLSVVFRESEETVDLTGIARKTVAGCVERMNRLYEQGADSLRIGQYVRRWLRWVNGGLGGLASMICYVGVDGHSDMLGNGKTASG